MKKLILLFSFLASTALAEPRPVDQPDEKASAASKVEIPATEDSVPVEVPQSRFDLQTLNQEFTPPKVIHLEITASSWSPTKLSNSSYLTNTTNFQHTGIPQLSINGWTGGWDLFSAINVAPKIGFSFARYQRTGNLGTPGGPISLSQTMNLYSFFFGLEVSSQKYFWGHLQAYMDAGIVPAYTQAPSSEFNDGTSSTLWAAKETLGLAWRFTKVKETPTADVAMEVGLEATQGLKGSNLTDTGVLTGLRLGL